MKMLSLKTGQILSRQKDLLEVLLSNKSAMAI
jgi:hypothetical protein